MDYSTIRLENANDVATLTLNRPELKNALKKDADFQSARAELDQTKRKGIYSEMGTIVHNEGGLICPMFNDFVEAVSDDVQGWEADGIQEVMNGLAPHKTWMA